MCNSEQTTRARVIDPLGTPRLSRTGSLEVAMTEPKTMIDNEKSGHETRVSRRAVFEGTGAALMATLLLGEASFATAAPAADSTLYQRLGGVFAIAAVIDHFSDAVVKNPIVGQGSKNPALNQWHTKSLARLPGLKFMRTLWVCNVSGGPFPYTATQPGSTTVGLEAAHRNLKISPAEFDEVAAELGRTLDHFKVPNREKGEVLGAFAAHKAEVTAGFRAAMG